MQIVLKNLINFTFVLMVGGAWAQTNLPQCNPAEWKNNCFGEGLYGSETFIGEWSKGQPNGIGRMTSKMSKSPRYGIWVGGYLDTTLPAIDVENWLDIYRNAKSSNSEGAAISKSNLPNCEGSYAKNTWTNCFGIQEGIRGEIYVGEFLNNTRSGKGVKYNSKGEILSSGVWRNNNFESLMQLDSQQFAFPYSTQVSSNTPQFVNQSVPVGALAGITYNATARRIALVVGNANYRTRPLRNPRNDADDVSNALKSTGFQVIDLRDATLQQMRAGVRQFGDRLINNDVGLVYYSGHGVEVKGRNYFIPVNADIMREDEIADQGLDVSLILEKMNTAGKGVNILIVDACRDDPFGRSFRSSSRGLAQMDAPRGTIIAYATSPGKVASDGDGRNSPYTKNLVRAMQQPNKPIEQVFKEVRRAVQEETKNQQTPWENTSLSGDFYFKVQK